jgi:hypothetical protein
LSKRIIDILSSARSLCLLNKCIRGERGSAEGGTLGLLVLVYFSIRDIGKAYSEMDVLIASARWTPPISQAEFRRDLVMRIGFRDERHFFNCEVQFRTMVMGCEALSSTTLLIRKRWPSGATAKLFLSPIRVD